MSVQQTGLRWQAARYGAALDNGRFISSAGVGAADAGPVSVQQQLAGVAPWAAAIDGEPSGSRGGVRRPARDGCVLGAVVQGDVQLVAVTVLSGGLYDGDVAIGLAICDEE